MDGFKNSTKTQYFTGGSVMNVAGTAGSTPRVQPPTRQSTTPPKAPEVKRQGPSAAAVAYEAYTDQRPKYVAGGDNSGLDAARAAFRAKRPAMNPAQAQRMQQGKTTLPEIQRANADDKARSLRSVGLAQGQKASPGPVRPAAPMKKGNGGSVEADDALMARMTPKELAMGRAGIAAARARLGKAPASGPAKKLPPKAVPVAPKRPLIESKQGYGPAKSLSIPLKNGGLAAMPNGKPMKKAVGGAVATPPAKPLSNGQMQQIARGPTAEQQKILAAYEAARPKNLMPDSLLGPQTGALQEQKQAYRTDYNTKLAAYKANQPAFHMRGRKLVNRPMFGAPSAQTVARDAEKAERQTPALRRGGSVRKPTC